MLQVKGLSVYSEENCIVNNATFQIKAGEKIILTGKSGIGKTIFARALYNGGEKLEYEISQDEIVFLPQYAEQSFNPLKRIIDHFDDIWLKKNLDKQMFYENISEYLNLLDLPFTCLQYYPFECSGGMLQRIQIILAHCQEPKLIIADEPTASLNETHIDKTFSFWEEACKKGMSLFIVTHQMRQYARFATKFLQLEKQKLSSHCQQSIINSVQVKLQPKVLLCCKMNGIAFRQTGGFWRRRLVPVLNIEDFTCQQGEFVGIRGKSGSGKTTFLNVLLSQLPFKGQAVLPRIQYLPQQCTESLPAKWTVAKVIREAQVAARCSKEECISLLEQLQLYPSLLQQTVQTLSGGQRQKLALFRVLVKRPQLLLLDEPFASLDEQITEVITHNLLQLVEQGLSIVIVSHDEEWLQKYTSKQYIVEQETIKEYHDEKNHVVHFYTNHTNSL